MCSAVSDSGSVISAVITHIRRVTTVATTWVLISVKGNLLNTVEKRQGRAHEPILRAKLHHLSENEKHIFFVIKLQKYLNLEFF